MGRNTLFGKAHKCPNCHAYLQAGNEAHVVCSYCGVTVTLRQPTKESPAVTGPPSPSTPWSPALWLLAGLVPLFVVGGLTSYRMLQPALPRPGQAQQHRPAPPMSRVPAPASEDPLLRKQRQEAVPIRTTERRHSTTRKRAPGREVDGMCHQSANDISAVLEPRRGQLAACFKESPDLEKLRVESSVIVTPSGTVTDATADVYGGQFTPSMRACAVREIRTWTFPAYDSKLPMRCNLGAHLVR